MERAHQEGANQFPVLLVALWLCGCVVLGGCAQFCGRRYLLGRKLCPDSWRQSLSRVADVYGSGEVSVARMAQREEN